MTAPKAIFIVSAALAAVSTAATDLKALGPALPPPVNLAANSDIRNVAQQITEDLHKAMSSGKSKFGTFSLNTSLSVTVASALEDAPMLQYHFTPPYLNTSAGSVSRVTGDSIYRIGSISKLFTTYSLLIADGWKHWDSPVTDFIPELRNSVSGPDSHSAIDHVKWNDVTVGALASQLAGIGRDYNNADLYSQGFPWEEGGLPKLSPGDIPTCAGNAEQPPCSRKEYFPGLNKRHPVNLPYTTPTYSNVAFRLLGYVLEAMTNASYDTTMLETVIKPLGLKHTSTRIPGNGVGVITEGSPQWDRIVGDEVATAGLFSSTNDLTKFGRALLNHKQLSALDTRRWMKPHSHTSAQFFSVGSPWEIWRTRSNITSGYTIDLYSKSGSDGDYNSHIFLVPDYQVVFSFLVAGPGVAAIEMAPEIVLQAMIPVLERISRSQACEKFCGRYVPEDPSSNSTLVLDMDEGGSGILVKQWTSHGHDIMDVANAYALATQGGTVDAIRLYPTSIQSRGGKGKGRQAAYRAVFETTPDSYDPSTHRILDPGAAAWGMFDQLMYGGIAADDFVFDLDADGNAKAIEPRVLRETFRKVSGPSS